MSYFNSFPSSTLFFLFLLFTSAVVLSVFLSEDHSEASLSFLKLAASTSYLIVRAVFAGTAYFLAFVINGLRVPSEALHSVLRQLTEAIQSVASYIGATAVDAVNSLLSTALELVKEAVGKLVELSTEGATAFAEQGKEGIEVLCKLAAEAARIMLEVVAGVVAELWNSCKEAVNYVMEKGE
ncbi:uncharacterized protein J3R85_013914 [Psidium guajava]|nr:uncharacterized protein J3R85_013914 [Psidium guajava]